MLYPLLQPSSRRRTLYQSGSLSQKPFYFTTYYDDTDGQRLLQHSRAMHETPLFSSPLSFLFDSAGSSDTPADGLMVKTLRRHGFMENLR
jgi:hypothetical protein